MIKSKPLQERMLGAHLLLEASQILHTVTMQRALEGTVPLDEPVSNEVVEHIKTNILGCTVKGKLNPGTLKRLHAAMNLAHAKKSEVRRTTATRMC